MYVKKLKDHEIEEIMHAISDMDAVVTDIRRAATDPLPCILMQHQKAGGCAVLQRLLRNQFFRQFIVKVTCFHGRTGGDASAAVYYA